MATNRECSHSNIVWIDWKDGGYVAAWKCQSCGEILSPDEAMDLVAAQWCRARSPVEEEG